MELVEAVVKNEWYVKNRYLMLIFVIGIVISSSLWAGISPDWLDENPSPMTSALFGYIFWGTLFILLRALTKRAAVDWHNLLGENSINYFKTGNLIIALPLLALSFAGFYLLYVPLSFWFPDSISKILFEFSYPIFWNSGNNFILANVLSFIDVCLISPIMEEIFFRGFLFTSLAAKWGINKAVIFSSLAFGILHVDIIGGMIFGIVLTIVYINTKSLYAPILIHSVYNTIVFIISYLYFFEPDTSYNLTELQQDWWYGIAGLLIGIPWLIYFYKNEVSNKKFNIPYFKNGVE